MTEETTLKQKYLDFINEVARVNPKVVVCAVSKQQPLDKIEMLYEAGCRDFAENRPQELKEKEAYFSSRGIRDIRWHFIGHIQSRQIPHILECSSLIHSIHSKETLFLCEKKAAAKSIKKEVLLQVNVSREASKQGFTSDEVLDLAKEKLELDYIQIKGVMTMAPQGASQGILQEIFRQTKELARKLQEFIPDCLHCSMGMSEDFSLALKEGATIIRIGSKIFK